ncbi:MAG: AAA family ATPase, partial [Clostridiales bacterium]|nr:AAA family ATPase [Clostridiales bacterium]
AVYSYRAFAAKEVIRFGAYSKSDELLPGNMADVHPLDKLLPCLACLLAVEMQTNKKMKNMLTQYIQNPAADIFVNIHEDFYQSHKADDYKIIYEDISGFDLTNFAKLSSDYQVMRENREEIKSKAEFEITAFASDAFDEEYLQYVPRLPAEFVLPSELRSVCSALTAGDILAALLHGPSGTGKTISCKLICQAIGLPIMETVGCTENLDEFVLGKYIPQDDRIVFRESYVTKAIRCGGAVVFEEINFAKPQYLSFLNSLLDDNGFVRLDNGDIVYRHPNFRFFATMNMGYYGTKELNQALYNRFDMIAEVSALSDEAIRRMLQARVPECLPVMEKLLGVYRKLKKKIEIEEMENVISPRNIENWARLAKYEGYIQAAEKTILPIAKCERVLEDTIRGIIALYKWS